MRPRRQVLLRPWPGGDDCLVRFSPAVAGHADHRDLIYLREGGERLFDLHGIDVLAAADYSVGGAINEVQPAVRVATAPRSLGRRCANSGMPLTNTGISGRASVTHGEW
jgi:hypothetical protein